MLKHDEPDYKRVALAVFLAAVLLVGWQAKVEWPRRQALAKMNAENLQENAKGHATHTETLAPKTAADTDENASLTREQRIAASPRIAIDSGTLKGSIALKGARFDDMSLVKYRETLESDSPAVTLLSPGGDDKSYFIQIGWVATDGKTKVPDQHSLWTADKKQLKQGESITLRWDNGEGVTFLMSIALNHDYLFDINQQVENHSGHEINLSPYAYINRFYEQPKQAPFLHEGPLGVMDGTLNEATYKTIKEKGDKTFDDTSGWFGITDKYWLTALIPATAHEKITYSHDIKKDKDRYQVDYLAAPQTIADGTKNENALRLFTGAKELKMLDQYTTGNTTPPMQPIPLFDRSLDFGYFYFLAKPMCTVVDWLYSETGNFGVALLIFIIIVKALMFPVANKSYKSMSQMRKLQPEITKIRERYHDDQIGLHKATRELYKREKVNPAAGCLPVLIQIVVFLALFRGLNVSIEMRHAPFYGWIKDLSAADPSNLFTAFGLVNWPAPTWLHLGLLPILYCITMIIQTRQQPKPADPVQAKMMTYMPFMMLLFFDKMASGFVLYWTWSNIISILQQRFISDRHGGTVEELNK